MRQAKNGQDVTFDAAADLSLLQFTAVKYAAAISGGQLASLAAAGVGERAHGILQNKPSVAGRGAVMRVSGFSKMVVDGNAGAIAAGDPLLLAAGGIGVKATTDKDHCIGWACEPSVAAGDIIEIQVRPFDLAV